MINIGLREIKKNLTNKVILLLFLSAKIVYDLNNVFYFLWSKVIPLIFAKFSLRGKIKFQLISIWRMTPQQLKQQAALKKEKKRKKKLESEVPWCQNILISELQHASELLQLLSFTFRVVISWGKRERVLYLEQHYSMWQWCLYCCLAPVAPFETQYVQVATLQFPLTLGFLINSVTWTTPGE